MFSLLKNLNRKRPVVLEEPEIAGFMPLNLCQKIFDTIVSLDAREVLEIGTFMGRSAWVIASALKYLGGKRKLVCVDWFGWQVPENHEESRDIQVLKKYYPRGYEHYLVRKKIGSDKEGYDYTLERFPFMKKIIDLRICDSRTLHFDREIFDFVFIDGTHTYEMIKNDFEKALPGLKRGGVLCFDDYLPEFPGIIRFIDELAGHPQLSAKESFGKLRFFWKT